MEENIKKEVQKLSNGKCIICHKETKNCCILDKNKPVEKENLILLCSLCADKFIGNSDLIKQLKQRRNYWYRQVKEAIKKREMQMR